MRRAHEILTDIRLQLDELEVMLGSSCSEEFLTVASDFDPDRDAPPVKPQVDGSRLQQDWCGLMLWAQLRSLNVRLGRGATHEESVAMAKAAGYQDGRGWNAWSEGWTKDDQGLRSIDASGMGHLRDYYKKVRRTLPDDLA